MSHPSHFTAPSPSKRHPLRTLSRLGVGGLLAYAGVGHLTFVREEFQAQVPDWVPVDDDTVVWLSGAAEIILGAALLSGRHKKFWGRSAAAFFAAIFPGNVGQLVEHKDGFGLDDDRKRAIRLLFQPSWWAWLWKAPARTNTQGYGSGRGAVHRQRPCPVGLVCAQTQEERCRNARSA